MSEYNVTRNDLFTITKNLRIIKALEKLFSKTGAIINDTNNPEIGTATSKANQAIGATLKNEQTTKGNKILLWLSM